MFTIIISEKGGAERREAFDRNEINVGRVQGNDLMLAKGNVSKHHARLLYRDGRFIVTDLKSTNGTYVNGRKITQATIVREGDKIYIGDFVLRLETGQAAAAIAASGAETPTHTPSGRAGPILREVLAAAGPAPSPAPEGAAPEAPTGAAVSPSRPRLAPEAPTGAAPALGPRAPEARSVSHFPLERDPDSESLLEARGPVLRGPAAVRAVPGDGRPRATTAMLGDAATPRRDPTFSPRTETLPRPTPLQTARRAALIALVDRVADAVDVTGLSGSLPIAEAVSQPIDAAIRAQAKAMRDEGEAPESLDLDQLAGDALSEMVGLGPIGPLLEDLEAQEIHVVRPDCVLAVRRGQASLVDPCFTSEASLARAIARLAYAAGEPVRVGEAIVDRRLPGGERMTAVGPPASRGWALTIRRPWRAEGSLDEVLRSGGMSRSMAVFLDACVAARANVLVVGPSSALVSSMVAVLVSAAGVADRIAMVLDCDQIAVAHAYVMPLALGGGASSDVDTLRAATRLRPDRLVIAPLAGALVAAALDAIGEGADGVIAGTRSPSLRHALARLSAQVALTHHGVAIESAREAVAESFDVAVDVARGSDGRLRVLRVAELAGADRGGIVVRDLFVSNAEGTGEAGFVPTGAIPRSAQDFAARGIKLDPALFKRR
jgi:pilus assembly protein CpaF